MLVTCLGHGMTVEQVGIELATFKSLASQGLSYCATLLWKLVRFGLFIVCAN